MILFLPSAPGLPPNAPDIRPILRAGTRDRVNVELYRYQWTEGLTDYRIDVEDGFLHDGASVPRVFWTLVGITPSGKVSAAALVHDYIYRHKGRMPAGSFMVQKDNGDWVDVPGRIARQRADKLFKKTMRQSGYNRVKSASAYRAIRISFWRNW